MRGFRFLGVGLAWCLILLASCSFNPPPNTGAYKRGLTETKRTNTAKNYIVLTDGTRLENPQDRVTVHMPRNLTHVPPPLPEPPKQRSALGVTNAGKANAILPKPMVTNQIPGSVMLTRITTTDKDGKKFTAELTLEGNQTIQANDRMAVVIFSINTSNYVIETCENIAEGRWSPLTSGTGQDTNSALIVVDLYATNQPIKFYRQKKM